MATQHQTATRYHSCCKSDQTLASRTYNWSFFPLCASGELTYVGSRGEDAKAALRRLLQVRPTLHHPFDRAPFVEMHGRRGVFQVEIGGAANEGDQGEQAVGL